MWRRYGSAILLNVTGSPTRWRQSAISPNSQDSASTWSAISEASAMASGMASGIPLSQAISALMLANG